MVHVAAIFAGEIVIFVAIVTQGYIISVNSDVTGVKKAAAMATGVIVAGAMAAYESIIVIHGHDVYVRHQFIAIFAIGIIVVAAIFADIIIVSHMILSSP